MLKMYLADNSGEILDRINVEEQDGSILTVICIVCGVVMVIMVFLAVLALLKKNRKKTFLEEGVSKTEAGVPLRLEIYSGKCRNKTASLMLVENLIIGSSQDCDIVFDDPDMAPKNSRISLVNSQVYIEDLDSPGGTTLDGMRIQRRNKLRGGEVISIGQAEFAVFFQ